ncbi:MAG: TonB-dependent receptor [Bacteroidia bacterium]|nr:TonB-dependent receptor [Bacteroidia bacterium]
MKVDSRRMEIRLNEAKTDLNGIRSVVSPLGEGDPIRWAQGLPGVTTGADGSSAMYVRGGDLGGNQFSLDGVPVYGYSHLLGLTTVVPQEIIQSASLSKGGFDGDESNFTSAHLQMETRKPDAEEYRSSAALNNFLISASSEGPVNDRISYLASSRISPLAWEYRAVKSSLPSLVNDFSDFRAGVADAYVKLHIEKDGGTWMDGSALFSVDRYGFITPDESDETMGWSNLIGIFRYHLEPYGVPTDITGYVNRYATGQKQRKVYREVNQTLSLQSGILEAGAKAERHHISGEHFSYDDGLDIRYTRLTPGKVGKVNNALNTLLATAYIQADYSIPDRLDLKGVVRGHYFGNYSRKGHFFSPDVSAYAKWSLSSHIRLEGTFDRMTQFYHTLEGLPVGWSMDMIVPTGGRMKPETAVQANLGMLFTIGRHTISLGAYDKIMDHLVWYKFSQALFTTALAGWEEDIVLGTGTSKGTELMYEYAGKDTYVRVAYTLSNTMREGFEGINDNKPFHARFDRPHVLNATAAWHGFNASFIYQSGQWESASAETYTMHIHESTWTAEYYSGVNNFQLPDIMRLDLGYQLSFTKGKLTHNVNLGVWNVTNHFNPFLLYFDTDTESWKEIALLPVLPNFSWRISF